MIRALASLSTCLLVTVAAHAADFTLAQVLGAPFPAGLTAAPAGSHVAWVFNTNGARTLWVAERGTDGRFHGHAVTHATGDDGVDMGELAWAPDGRAIAYTQGGSFEGGPGVNPLSLTAGRDEQAVWLASLDGLAPRRLGPGHSAVVSPTGDVLAYLSDGQIWTAPLAHGAPMQLLHDRGEASALAWSPDGRRLAFVSTRAGHSIVGVITRDVDRVTWLAPSLDSDAAPEWSPDGRSVAFVRQPAGEGAVDFTSHRTDAPWSIWVADPASGAGHALWTASPGDGSLFHPALSDRALIWRADGSLVFPWERTGWLHLYALPTTGGGTPVELTPGSGEVFDIAVAPDRRRIVYSTNSADIERWHLASLAPGDAAPARLSDGDGIEDYPAITGDGAVLALHGDARLPLRPVLVSPDGLGDVVPETMPHDFPSAALVVPRTVTFPASDGLTVHGQLFLPPHGTAGRAPAIMFFHGGPYRQMLPAWHPMNAYSWMYGFNQLLANEGFVVLSVNYRGGIGYGLAFREAPGFGAGGASELHDIEGAGAWLRGRADVDATRIGIWGGSYGGLMTALGLARAPDLFAAGVDYAGVHDWQTQGQPFSGPAAALAWTSSVMSTLDRWRAPVLIAHNDDDREVPFGQSIELLEGLRARHLEPAQLVMPDEHHVMLRAASWRHFFEAAEAFLSTHLHADTGTTEAR